MLLALLLRKGLAKGGSQPSEGVSPCPLQSALLLSFQNLNSPLLNNYVLGAQLGLGHVRNLREPINISFQHNQSLVLFWVVVVGCPHFHLTPAPLWLSC